MVIRFDCCTRGALFVNSLDMKRILEKKLENPEWRTSFNHQNDQFRIEWKNSKKGITIDVPPLIGKYQQRGEKAIDEIVFDIKEALKIMNEDHQLQGMEKHIFPVIRSTSFPTESKGKKLVTKDHTAETRVFYALDLGNSYRLIDDAMLKEQSWTEEQLHEMALFNLRSLPNDFKMDELQGNTYYFIATQDGYDASRILNESFLIEMANQCSGEVAISVPHQDVLIIADIHNDTGYDILAQMTMRFFAEGRIPITSLSFIYEDKKLEPIFILARKKPRDDKS